MTLSRKRILPVCIIISAVLLCLSLSSCLGYEPMTVSKNLLPYKELARDIMERHGLDPGTEYDIGVYESIASEITEENICGFHELLGIVESEKVVIVLGYLDWEDYQKKHGYVDDNGNPSYAAMMNAWNSQATGPAEYETD